MLTLVCGLPRSGKTTYCKRYGDSVIHCDRYGRHGVIGLMADICGDVVIDGVYHLAEDRRKLLESYRGEGSICIWIDTPLDIRRRRPMWTWHGECPFEPPTVEEGWDEVIVLRGGSDGVEPVR